VPRQNPREIAVRVLRQWAAGSDPLEALFEAQLAQAALAPIDRALARELVYGIVRWQTTLDWLVARKTNGRAQRLILGVLLRLGLFQIFWLDRIPDHAAVNETVALARQFGCGHQAGFLNAMLRSYARQKEATRQALRALQDAEPALGYSHPAWLVERWTRRWGHAHARQLLQWNNTPAKTCARLNTLRADAGQLLEQWRNEGVDYDFGRWDWLPENLVFPLKAHPPLAGLPSFQRGWFYVQDPSTLLAAQTLAPQPGEAVLDFCAAPGGKTTFIAQQMRDQGRVLAHDTSPARLKMLQDNCARLGVSCVELAAHLDRPAPASQSARFDRVLVDVPCSNTGVMRRRVEVRWRLWPEAIARLHAKQSALLEQAAQWVKTGGVLVYSTCSLEPEENRQVVDEFLAAHPGWQLECDRELLPFVEGVDGAYVARLRLGDRP
jgi:16S rRNA (cytosine967-C5)-methyltransferase